MTDEAEHDDGPEEVVQRRSADEAFELLGNETRVGILAALFEVGDPLGFSALHDRVDVRDSGQFNYHLKKLVGSFVAESEEGYELSNAGERVVGSVLAGFYTKSIEETTVPVDGNCSHCGNRLVGRFVEDVVWIRCEDCDRDLINLPVPAGTFEEYPREEWPLVAEKWARLTLESAAGGFCPVCNGPTTKTVDTDSERMATFDAVVDYDCRRCNWSIASNVESNLLTETAVLAFYHDHGIDPRETPIWDLKAAVTPTATVVSTDPLRVEVPFEIDGDRLVVTVDGTATVVDTRREAAD